MSFCFETEDRSLGGFENVPNNVERLALGKDAGSLR